jgi:hypothetical protein
MIPPHDSPGQAPAAPAPAPGAVTSPIPLPPRPAPAAAADSPRGRRVWDRVLTGLVLVLAFLAASFVARNSDVWFHLASGRLLAQGQVLAAEDPFAYTAERGSWPPPGWLFDLAMYGLHALAGGAVLVALKALLVAALAGLLLAVRRPDGARWPPVVCTALAVLAMSPRLLLQPACVSYALLGLTFWLLWRPLAQPDEAAAATKGARRLWPYGLLLGVFVLWVNVDEWFLLGPALAAQFWLGERLAGPRRTPAWLAPAGVAACLLNPQTYHVFALPPELSPVTWTAGLRQDVRFQAQFLSPWQPASLRAAAELGAAPLAYYTLTLLGLLGFLLRPRALLGWRLAVWLPFALLAAWQVRLVPFFAVVAAPVAAVTWQDLLADRRAAAPGRRRRAGLAPALGRFALGLGLLALIVLTWPGWLAGYGREERRVGWGLQADPSLQRVTETLHDWRRRGLLLPGEQVFALSPEVAQHGAWFSPGERYFFDHRYGLLAGAARDYETVCRALAPELAPPGAPSGDWRRVLRERRVGVVVVSDRDPQRLYSVLHRVAGDPDNWTLLNVSGDALVFGRNEARPPGGFASLAFDAERLALGPPAAGAEEPLPPAPDRGLERLPDRPTFWTRFIQAPAPVSWESAAAGVYLHDFGDSESQQAKRQLRVSLGGYTAGLAGLAAWPPTAPAGALQVVASRDFLFPPGGDANAFLTPNQLGPYFAPLGLRSPALPLLAVRAARRAVAADPADANAWLRLGQAYVLLRDETCERAGHGVRTPLDQLREVQIATALEQAVRLDPDLEQAHEELAHLYGERNFLDVSLAHLGEELRLSRGAGPRPGETSEDFSYRLGLLERDFDKLDKYVRDRRKEYASASPTLGGERLRQAELALKMGLARQAVDDILLPCPADLLGAPGIRMELELLLMLGRAEDVRGILADPTIARNRQVLAYFDLPATGGADGTAFYPIPYHWPAYEWLQTLDAAALGDYALARENLVAIRSGVRAGQERLWLQLREGVRPEWALLPWLLSDPSTFLPVLAARDMSRFAVQRTALEAAEPVLIGHQADLDVLQGLLALERGDKDEARTAFTAAQQLGAPFAGAPIAAPYLEELNITAWATGP